MSRFYIHDMFYIDVYLFILLPSTLLDKNNLFKSVDKCKHSSCIYPENPSTPVYLYLFTGQSSLKHAGNVDPWPRAQGGIYVYVYASLYLAT